MQDGIVATTSNHPANTGLVIGVLNGDQRSVHGYGAMGGDPPAGDAVFEIGSVTKVFTTSLLSILVNEGTVGLDEPAANLSRELAGFPAQITLQRLATHTSGLPKMPTNILRSMLRDRGNPYAAYTTEELLRWVSTHPPSMHRIERAQISYSNLGMALLGTLLARLLNETFEAAVKRRVCEPLGMHDTSIRLAPDMEHRLVIAHRSNGKSSRNWDLPAFAGAGALKSTTDDLLTFLAANLGSGPPTVLQALKDCHRVHASEFAPPGALERLIARASRQNVADSHTQEAMALGWTVGRLQSDDAPVHWHHGATGGYRAFVGFIQARQIAVVVLANSGPTMRDGVLGTTATDRVGFGVLEHLVAAE